MSNLARKLIKQANDSKANYLELGRCSLTSDTIPEELFELEHLEELVLSNEWWEDEKKQWQKSRQNGASNRFSFLPSGFNELKKLKKLVVAGDNSLPWAITDLQPIANLSNLELLDCSYNQITDLTPLNKLLNLTVIDCSYNKLNDLSFAEGLVNLTQIYCSSNKIVDLSHLEGLVNLKKLYFGDNEVTDLSPLENLSNLTELNCTSNILTTLLPIESLNSLIELDCSNNLLTDINPVRGLNNLVELNCSGNRITDLNPIIDLNRLVSFECKDNLLTSPPLEVTEQGLIAIRAYLEATQKAELILNNEVKMIVLGNSTSGKSSFIEWLQTGKISKNRSSTHGMETQAWKPRFSVLGLPGVTIKILDFGGQEFYHDTHHLFLTSNALYVLLWEKQRNQHGYQKTPIVLRGLAQEIELEHFPITYWLDCINYFTKLSISQTNFENLTLKTPTLVVQNRIDEVDNGLVYLNQEKLRKRFPFITDFAAVSLLEKQRTGILMALFKEFCQQQTVIGQHLPNYWLTIRAELLQDSRKVMDYRSFVKLCISIRPDMSIDEVCTVCLFLRNTFYLQCFFANESTPQPDELVVTDPSWLTDCIYKVLNTELSDSKGVFDKNHIRNSLNQPKFNDQCSFILDLLLRFKLIFIRSSSKKEEYIAPHYLPDKPSEDVGFFTNNYKPFFRFTYGGFLHRRVILELFAEFAENLSPKYIIWKYGMVLTDGIDRLLIRFYREGNSIEILSDKDVFFSSELSKKVVETIRKVNQLYHSEEWISLNGKSFLLINEIKNAFDERLSEFRFQSQKFRTADFQAFIPYLDLKKIPQFHNQRLFISYSKFDKHHREELEAHLSSLRREGIINVWHDGMLEIGKEWDSQVKNELAACDIIILLISAKFIQTEYTWEIEFREALQRHDRGQVKVLPIIVEYCSWENLIILSKLNALPEKGKPIESGYWYNRSEAWTEVIKKLRDLILADAAPEPV